MQGLVLSRENRHLEEQNRGFPGGKGLVEAFKRGPCIFASLWAVSISTHSHIRFLTVPRAASTHLLSDICCWHENGLRCQVVALG